MSRKSRKKLQAGDIARIKSPYSRVRRDGVIINASNSYVTCNVQSQGYNPDDYRWVPIQIPIGALVMILDPVKVIALYEGSKIMVPRDSLQLLEDET
jgi:hypothetical protein